MHNETFVHRKGHAQNMLNTKPDYINLSQTRSSFFFTIHAKVLHKRFIVWTQCNVYHYEHKYMWHM